MSPVAQAETTEENITIRPFRDSDLAELTELQKGTWGVFYKDILPPDALASMTSEDLKEKWRQRMHYPMPPLDVAEIDGQIVGAICYGPSLARDLTRNTQLYSLYIHPDYYGKGIVGKALIEHVQSQCEASCEAIEGWLSPENEYTDSFLQGLGFQKTDQKRVIVHGGFPLEEVLYVLPLK